MRHEKWKCPKCDNDEFETDVFQATGGTLAKLFDVPKQEVHYGLMYAMPIHGGLQSRHLALE